MADLAVPASFAFNTPQGGSQAAATTSANPINLAMNAPTAQITAGASGGEFRAQAQIDAGTIDQIVKMGSKTLQPKVEQAQKELFNQGYMRRLQGESLESIISSQPWYANLFGDNQVAEGARLYSVQDSYSKFHSGIINDMPNLRQMDPASFTKQVQQRTEGMMTGDAQADTAIQQLMMKSAPTLQEAYIKENYAWKQEEAGKAQYKAMQSSADLLQQQAGLLARGMISPESYKQLATDTVAGLAPPEGSNPLTYQKTLQTFAQDQAIRGNLNMLNALREHGVIDALPADQQAQIDAYAEQAKPKAKTIFAAQHAGDIANLNYRLTASPYEGGVASVEEAASELAKVNNLAKQTIGLGDSDTPLVDVAATLANSKIVFAKRDYKAREQAFESANAQTIAGFKTAVGTGAINGLQAQQGAQTINAAKNAAGLDPLDPQFKEVSLVEEADKAQFSAAKAALHAQQEAADKLAKTQQKIDQHNSDIQWGVKTLSQGDGKSSFDAIRDKDTGAIRPVADHDKEDMMKQAFDQSMAAGGEQQAYGMLAKNVASPSGSVIWERKKNDINANMNQYAPQEVDGKFVPTPYNIGFDNGPYKDFSGLMNAGGPQAAVAYFGQDNFKRMLDYDQALKGGQEPEFAFNQAFNSPKQYLTKAKDVKVMADAVNSYLRQPSISPGFLGTLPGMSSFGDSGMGASGSALVSALAAGPASKFMAAHPGMTVEDASKAGIQAAKTELGLQAFGGYAFQKIPTEKDFVDQVAMHANEVHFPAPVLSEAVDKILLAEVQSRGASISGASSLHDHVTIIPGLTDKDGLTWYSAEVFAAPRHGETETSIPYTFHFTNKDVAGAASQVMKDRWTASGALKALNPFQNKPSDGFSAPETPAY